MQQEPEIDKPQVLRGSPEDMCPELRASKLGLLVGDAAIRLFHICDYCNVEYELSLGVNFTGDLGHNFSQCPHCEKRNHVWIRVECAARSGLEALPRLEVKPSTAQGLFEGSVEPDSVGTDPKGKAGALKTPLHLIPPAASREIAWVHAHGADKYEPYNWRATPVQSLTYVAAIMRHLDAWRDGQDLDPESGLSHLAHIGANVNIMLDAKACGMLVDNRHKVAEVSS